MLPWPAEREEQCERETGGEYMETVARGEVGQIDAVASGG